MGSIRRRESGTYEAIYRDPAGRTRSRSFKTKAQARSFLSAVETEKQRGTWTDPQFARTRFEDWAEEYWRTKLNRRASTKARDDSYLRNHVLPAFGRAPLGAITQPDVRAWVEELVGSGLAPNTVKQCYRLLAATLAAAVDARLIPESPCRNISLPRPANNEQRFLSPEEVQRLAETIAAPFRALVLSAAYLGCRWGELVGLKRTRLNLLHGTVDIVGTLEEVGGMAPRYVEATKTTNSRRRLSVPAFLIAELRDHLSEAPPSDFVFFTVEGHPLRRNNFRRRYWLPAVGEAGLKPLRFHDLRHTCASLLIAQGAHAKEIQIRLGHASIATTMNVYGHLLPSLDERLIEGLDKTYQAAKMAR